MSLPFVPFPVKNDRTASGRSIAVIWSSLSPSIRSQVENGIGAALRGEQLSIMPHHLMPGLPARMIEETSVLMTKIAADGNVIGLLVAFADVGAEDVRRIEARGIPVVTLERPRPDGRPGAVTLDHAGGARQAALAMVELGRRKIAYIGPCESEGYAGSERFRTVAEVLRENKLPFLYEHEPYFDRTEAVAATHRLLERETGIDAIIYGADVQAIGGIGVLKEKGFAVPRDIAVIGFDDSSSARTCDPPLSSVRQPFEEAGFRAVRMLVKHVGESRKPLDSIELEEEVILRASCIEGLAEDLAFQAGTEMLKSYARR